MPGAIIHCVLVLGCLERSRSPVAILNLSRNLLNPNGLLLLWVNPLDWSSRATFQKLSSSHPDNCFFFSRTTLQLLLEKTGFRKIWMTPLVSPKGKAQGFIVTCRKMSVDSRVTLSIVMPVYNERHTVKETLEAVLRKEIPGIAAKEVVLVESNSTDGTREVVRSFEGTPGLKIIYEDGPKGKGHAVRTGFMHAIGDVILIQDADCEYDVSDYDDLLQPLLDWECVFVLGSRHHGDDWEMRRFTDNAALAALFNFGHVIFTWLMNTLYRQKMRDPFTMYKVFRRECLYGLHLECNRFDFDHELVIKLLLKGYTPREIPVNYCSRSYSEGKKVSLVLDPLLWIKANAKYRFVSPFESAAQLARLAYPQRMTLSQPAQAQPDGYSQAGAKTALAAAGAVKVSVLPQAVEVKEAVHGGRRTRFSSPLLRRTTDTTVVDAVESESACSEPTSHGSHRFSSPLLGIDADAEATPDDIGAYNVGKMHHIGSHKFSSPLLGITADGADGDGGDVPGHAEQESNVAGAV